MSQSSDIISLHKKLNKLMQDVEKQQTFPDYFYHLLLAGDLTLYQKSITEIKEFHEDWIGTIESYFPSLNKITKDPKSGLKYLQEVEAIEKAKKVNSDSIRHLSANTHFIKEVKNNNVIPKKILTTQAEINYAIYENRFIKTLVDRLYHFVESRYSLVKHNIESFHNRIFDLKSLFHINDAEVDLSIHMNVKETIEDQTQTLENKKLLNRIEFLMKQIGGIMTSPFMQDLKDVKPVTPPIMQTSILLKNVDYKNCYTLWLYLDKYNVLNFDVDVTEKNLTFDQLYLRNIYQSSLFVYANILGNQEDLKKHYEYLNVKDFKKKSPEVITKSMDELLTSTSPIELEDQQVNQYFLDKNKELLKERIEQVMETGKSYDQSLKQVLKDTLTITNALYQGYFELDSVDEDRIFDRLRSDDIEQQIEKTKEKIKIAKLIREVKELDFNQTIRMEKRLLKDLDYLEKQYVKVLKRRSIEQAEKEKIEEQIKIERKHLEENQKMLNEHLEFVRSSKENLASENKQLIDQLKLDIEKNKLEEKALIQAEKEKAQMIYQLQQDKLKQQQMIEKRKLEEQIKKDRQKQLQKVKLERQKQQEATKKRIEKEKAKIKASLDQKLKKLKGDQ